VKQKSIGNMITATMLVTNSPLSKHGRASGERWRKASSTVGLRQWAFRLLTLMRHLNKLGDRCFAKKKWVVAPSSSASRHYLAPFCAALGHLIERGNQRGQSVKGQASPSASEWF
jgi:hypothetical protein